MHPADIREQQRKKSATSAIIARWHYMTGFANIGMFSSMTDLTDPSVSTVFWKQKTNAANCSAFSQQSDRLTIPPLLYFP
jgi:hypothetical protein